MERTYIELSVTSLELYLEACFSTLNNMSNITYVYVWDHELFQVADDFLQREEAWETIGTNLRKKCDSR